jgi:hypothetical protein
VLFIIVTTTVDSFPEIHTNFVNAFSWDISFFIVSETEKHGSTIPEENGQRIDAAKGTVFMWLTIE